MYILYTLKIKSSFKSISCVQWLFLANQSNLLQENNVLTVLLVSPYANHCINILWAIEQFTINSIRSPISRRQFVPLSDHCDPVARNTSVETCLPWMMCQLQNLPETKRLNRYIIITQKKHLKSQCL